MKFSNFPEIGTLLTLKKWYYRVEFGMCPTYMNHIFKPCFIIYFVKVTKHGNLQMRGGMPAEKKEFFRTWVFPYGITVTITK